MDEDESNLQETIENDLKNRNQGPIERKIRKEAKKKAKEAARKAKRKMRNTLFKKAGWSSLIGVFPIFIILFMIIGIISFITTMPGLVQEQILKKILDTSSSLNFALKGSDYYLTELVKDSDHKAQKKILLYLDDMGIDPVGFGFAPFYNRSNEDRNPDEEWKNVSYEPTVGIDDVREVGGFFDSVKYNNEMAKKAMQEDLILKYVIASERTYLVHDLDKIANWSSIAESFRELMGSDFDLSGMIITQIDGLDDSTISVDRENKQMVIESMNLKWDWLDTAIYIQTAKYNLETWTGRYGMPLEFLLALHIGTMTSDLTNEMITNPNLHTEVNVETIKDNYDVEYKVTYDGEELPFRAKSGGTNDDLAELRDHFKINDNNDVYIDLTDEELQAYKDDVSINSLTGLLDSMFDSAWNFNIDYSARTLVMEDTKNAFLGADEYRVRYEIMANSEEEGIAVWKMSSFFGNVLELNDGQIEKGFAYNPSLSYDPGEGLWSEVRSYPDDSYESDGYWIRKFRYNASSPNADAINDEYTGNVYINLMGPEPINLRDKVGLTDEWQSTDTSGYQAYTTAVLHGIDYYINGHEDEVINNEYIQLGITCILSQFDSFMYAQDLESFSGDIHFRYVQPDRQGDYFAVKVYSEDGNDYFEYEIPYGIDVYNPSGENVNWLLTAHWLQYLNDNKGNYTAAGMQQELEYLRDNLNVYYELIDNKAAHIQDALDRFLFVLYGIQLDVNDIYDIYDALCNNNEDFEFCIPRIEYVIKHWYKDVIFEGFGVNVYRETNEPIELPLTLDAETDKPLEITAILSGGRNFVQEQEPYVVKGDIVTVDGEIVDSDLPDQYVDGYRLGDGYRTSKKLFTQGQYYVFDGSTETAKSIWYAKQLENLGTKGNYAKVYTSRGRIYLSWVFEDDADAMAEFGISDGSNPWGGLSQEIDDDRRNDEIVKDFASTGGVKTADDGSYTIFLKRAIISPTNDLPLECFYIKANDNMEYVSAAEDVDESKKSVERINAMLEAMGVVTIRKPVSFDNTTVTGDVTTLTAFGLLENMHTESAEYIYRDLKEFLIELGYYTKAEFELIETNVLKWFIPDYLPATNDKRVSWNQAKEEDILKYGAMLYPTEIDADGRQVNDGFEADMNVIAPGNCKVIELSSSSITIEFDGISQPEIGALDKYSMIINGIETTGDAVKVLTPDGDFASMTLSEIKGTEYVIVAEEVIGKTGTTPIQVILKNRLGGYVNDIEDYMAPEVNAKGTLRSQEYQFTEDEIILLAYIINHECAPEGIAQYMHPENSSVYDTAEEMADAYAKAEGYVLINRALSNYGGWGEKIEEQSIAPNQWDGSFTISNAVAHKDEISAGSLEAAKFCAQYACSAIVNPRGVEMTEDVVGASAWTSGNRIFWWLDVTRDGIQNSYEGITNPTPPYDNYLTYSN